uniref:Envelope glycoprotein n=1 Tax=Xenopus tropicalis TaxID=8364 RepID=A0A803JYR9_XENTR
MTQYLMLWVKVLVFVALYFTPVKGGWQTNSIWLLHQQAAKQLNTTDCWICSHVPVNHKGIPLVGIPISMNDLNLTDYSYEVAIDTNHTYQNAINDQGTYLEITGLLDTPTICVGPMFVNHTIKMKDHVVNIPKIHVGNTDCENATLKFYMDYMGKKCDKMQGNCNDFCWCGRMNTSCAPRCSCPNQDIDGIVNCESKVTDNMRWFQTWLGYHGTILPRVLRQGLYYICGNRAYSWLPMGAWGNCTIGRVVPAIRQRLNISYIDNQGIHSRVNKQKRELFSNSDKAWMWFPAWTGWGIELANRLNKYASIMDGIINETTSSIHIINEELAQVRKVTLQNRMALDYLLAVEGGVCAIIGKECCTWIEDSHDQIEAHMHKVKELQQKARDISKEGWNPFSWMGNIGTWLSSFLKLLWHP